MSKKNLLTYSRNSEDNSCTNSITVSSLSDKEVFVCIYYFYFFCWIGSLSMPDDGCYSFFWYLVRRYKKEKQLSYILSNLVTQFEKEGWLVLRTQNEFDNSEIKDKKYFPNTDVEIKYTADIEIWEDEIKYSIEFNPITQCTIDFYRCMDADMFEQISMIAKFIRILFFEPAFTKEKKAQSRSRGLNANPNISISDFKPEYAKILTDLSKVQFLIDMVGISELEARFLLLLYHCEIIRDLSVGK